MLSLTRMMASARRRAWSVGLRRTKKVRRCAVFTPMPGSFENSSISAATGGAMLLMGLEHSWDSQTPGNAGHHLLRLTDFVECISGRRQHHHLEVGYVFRTKRFGIDLDSSGLEFAVHGDSDCATASRAGEFALLQFLLHLHQLLLCFLKFSHVHQFTYSFTILFSG